MGTGMDETYRAGVESLSRQYLEAVVDELAVAGVEGALEDTVTAVEGIVEEGVADVVHVHAYLVGASCLQAALYHGDVAQTLKDPPVRDGMLACTVLYYLEAYASSFLAMSRVPEVSLSIRWTRMPMRSSSASGPWLRPRYQARPLSRVPV